MWHRVNREELGRSNPVLEDREGLDQPFRWRVYKDYEILPTPNGSGRPYIQAASRGGLGMPECVKAYNPLIDTPHLFLEFARIVERKDPDQALMDWFHVYGLLGITRHNEHFQGSEGWRSKVFPQRYNDDRGGPWDHFEAIWSFAHEANESLILYEAVLGRNEEKLEVALFPEDDPEYAEIRRRTLEKRAESSGAGWVDTLVDAALWQVLEYAMGGVYAYAYPDVALPQRRSEQDLDEMPLLTVGHLNRSWGVRNLLGAISLQFYWLITSVGQLSRCRFCGRIISYAPPIPIDNDVPRARKPRRDKEFCDKYCRQNYHYHNRVKPRRKS